MRKYLSYALAGLLAGAVLTGCGGSGSTTAAQPANTGYLVDAPVAGVAYTCGDYSSQTGSNGEFKYDTGDTCTFEIGNVVLGQVDPSTQYHNFPGIVTPVELAGGDQTEAVDIARLLMAADSDDDPTNGITVDPETVEDFSQLPQQMNIASPDVSFEDVVNTLVQEGVIPQEEATNLPTAEEVQQHLANLDQAVEEIAQQAGLEEQGGGEETTGEQTPPPPPGGTEGEETTGEQTPPGGTGGEETTGEEMPPSPPTESGGFSSTGEQNTSGTSEEQPPAPPPSS